MDWIGVARPRQRLSGDFGGDYARQRTDKEARFEQSHSPTEDTSMSNQLHETGWQRFLDRLKQLWGKSVRADVPAAAASVTDGRGASGPRASGDTRASGPGGP